MKKWLEMDLHTFKIAYTSPMCEYTSDVGIRMRNDLTVNTDQS